MGSATGSSIGDLVLFFLTLFVLNRIGLLKPLLGIFLFVLWLMSRIEL